MLQQVVDLYASGISLRAIASIVGLSSSGVAKMMKRNGYTMRQRGGSSRSPDETYFDQNYIPEPNSGCWLWIGRLDQHGYGRMTYRGVRSTAQRASYQRFKGDIPAGLQVDHKCFNPACVNPDHLQIVTKSQNLATRRLSKRFCKQGHSLAEDNIVIWRNGRGTVARRCKICLHKRTRKAG